MSDVDIALAEEVGKYYDDPVGFINMAFEWGEGSLQGFDGLDTWQLDILTEISEAVKKNNFNGVDAVDPVQVAVSSGHGIGKGHPIDMEYGDGYWGEMKTGDTVFNDQGELTPIKSTNHYRREHYRVTFDDGSSTIVSGQHEWNVRGRQHRRKKIEGWDTVETNELIRRGVKRPNGSSMARQWEIPVQKPVMYPECSVPVDAYTYGVWMGDGDKRSGRVTNIDQEVWDNVAYSTRTTGIARTLLGLKRDLVDNNLFGCTTYNLTVDKRYMGSSSRLEVLQGLLDTDGWVEDCGSAAFCSASRQLVRDVIWMARSLGLKAREEKYKPNDCAGAWYTHITWDGKTTLFRIKRKQDKLIHAEHRYQCRWIDSIESVGMMDGMCIEVEGGLYLAPEFIVTHNSAFTAMIILWIMSTRPNCKGVVTANTGEQLKTKTMSELAKWHTRCITGHWFEMNSMSIVHRAYPKTWRCDALTSREEASEGFAGLHAADSSPFFIFDEASAIPEKIWEVARGGLTDGEAFFLSDVRKPDT